MRPNVLAILAFTATFLPVAPRADENSPWHFDTSLNLFLAGLTGNVTARGVPTHVDATFANIFEHLEAGFAGRATAGYNRWLLSTEFSYMKLGPATPIVELEVE